MKSFSIGAGLVETWRRLSVGEEYESATTRTICLRPLFANNAVSYVCLGPILGSLAIPAPSDLTQTSGCRWKPSEGARRRNISRVASMCLAEYQNIRCPETDISRSMFWQRHSSSAK